MKKEVHKEAVLYLINGGATTAVNYIIYFLLLYINWNFLAANSVAWLVAVMFAYVTNRFFVFHSGNEIKRELLSFLALRFLTLLVENLLLLIFIQYLGVPSIAAKLCVSVVTVLSNYVICKCSIFRKGVVNHE